MNRLGVFIFGAFSVSLGYGMLAPLAATLVDETGSIIAVGLLIGVYPLAKAAGYSACLLPVARQWPISVMLLLAAMSYCAIGLAFEPIVIGAARCIEGFVFGWFMARASLEIAARGTAIGHRLGWLNGMSSAGVLAGPLLITAASIFLYSRAAFLVVAALCATAAAVAFNHQDRVDETIRPDQVGVDRGRRLGVGSLALIAAFALFDLTFGMLSLSVPMVFRGIEADEISGTAAVFSGGFLIFAATMPIFGRLADNLNPKVLLVSCLGAISALFYLPLTLPITGAVFTSILLIEYLFAAAAYAAALAVVGRFYPGMLPMVGIIQSLAMFFGSAIAGVLIAEASPESSFFVLAFAYLLMAASITLLLKVPRALQQGTAHEE